MKITAERENIRTMAAALGIDEGEAENLLDVSLLITCAADDDAAALFASELNVILQRTVTSVTFDLVPGEPDLEVIIADSQPRTRAKSLFVSIEFDRITISERKTLQSRSTNRHPVLLLIGACYTAAKALAFHLAERFPYRVDEPLVLDYRAMFPDYLDSLHETVDLETVYLAGAGAVGNGYLYGLRYFTLRGTIHVVDPKVVKDGNLNRCLFFTMRDLGMPKAERLCENAQQFFHDLKLIPRAYDLRELAERDAGPWLKRLVVTVDSRRVRRNLQSEIPREVYDASTTGIQEVVLHFNQQPGSGKACMSCIYMEEEGEITHEHHVAEVLGVPVDKVRSNFIDVDAAAAISKRYPEISQESIIGVAYDSLFKQMCGQGKLVAAADKQVLAPFAFVSVLAGTMLAVEMVGRLKKGKVADPFNYWRLAPYNNPVIRAQYRREKIDNCEFCANDKLVAASHVLWGAGEKGAL